jgi:hypothetical protein
MLAYVCGGAALMGLIFTVTLLPRQAPAEDHYAQLEPEPEPEVSCVNIEGQHTIVD